MQATKLAGAPSRAPRTPQPWPWPDQSVCALNRRDIEKTASMASRFARAPDENVPKFGLCDSASVRPCAIA